jgi:outer membrane protein
VVKLLFKFVFWMALGVGSFTSSHGQYAEVDQVIDGWRRQTQVVLQPDEFGRWAVLRSAKMIAQRAQTASVHHLVEAERALYDSVLTLSSNRSYMPQRRTTQEVNAEVQKMLSCLQNLNPSSPCDLTGLNYDSRLYTTSMGYGIKGLLPTGAQLEMKHSLQNSVHNLSMPANIHESRGNLTITLTQPLLKGRGREFIEADLQVAEREQAIELQNLSRQTLDTLGEAVATYWQLYQAEQVLHWRNEAVRLAKQAVQESRIRLANGSANALEIKEAQLALSVRDVELTRARQKHIELQARVRGVMNLSGIDYQHVSFTTGGAPIALTDMSNQSVDTEAALFSWPSYRVAQIKEEQERIRFEHADRLRSADLNFTVSALANPYASPGARDAMTQIGSTPYKGWSVGLNYSRPIGNGESQSKFEAQSVKLMAASDVVNGERVAWTNELVARTAQYSTARKELESRREAVKLRQEALNMQREYLMAGRSRTSQILEREDQLIDSVLQEIEGYVNLRLAELQLQAIHGTVLRQFGITLSEQH